MTKAEAFKLVKELKTIFGDAQQFVLTGSIVAGLQGFPTKMNDIDILLINPSEATVAQLKRHVTDNPRTTKTELMNQGVYLFTFHGQKVDIFVQSQPLDDKLQYDGIIISPLMSLVQAKQSFWRLKDFLQLRSWAKLMHDPDTESTDIEKLKEGQDY
jgi:hypothetical protein